MATAKNKAKLQLIDLRDVAQFRAEHGLPLAMMGDTCEEGDGECLPDGFTVEPCEDGKTDVYCYCPIGGYTDWDGKPMGISAAAFAREWRKVEAAGKPARCYFNTPGGDVFDGAAIYNILARSKVAVEGYVDGTALSISSMILMACDTIHMAETSWLMLHNPWSVTVGNAADHEKTIGTLNTLKSGMCAAYCKRSGMKAEEMDRVMGEETWLTAAQAKEMGLCDDIVGPKNVQARCDIKRFASQYRNMPKDVYTFFNAGSGVRVPQVQPTPDNGENKEIQAMEKPVITLDTLRTEYPEVYASARKEAVTAERERIQQIRAAAFDGQDALVDKLIADGVEVAPAAIALNKDFKAAGTQTLKKLEDETSATVIAPASEAKPQGQAKEPELTEEQLIRRYQAQFEREGKDPETALRLARRAVSA